MACRLLNVDVYSFDFKIHHITRHIQLPEEPVVSAAAKELPPDEQLPPLLIINVQLPTYPVSQHFDGSRDGAVLPPLLMGRPQLPFDVVW